MDNPDILENKDEILFTEGEGTPNSNTNVFEQENNLDLSSVGAATWNALSSDKVSSTIKAEENSPVNFRDIYPPSVEMGRIVSLENGADTLSPNLESPLNPGGGANSNEYPSIRTREKNEAIGRKRLAKRNAEKAGEIVSEFEKTKNAFNLIEDIRGKRVQDNLFDLFGENSNWKKAA